MNRILFVCSICLSLVFNLFNKIAFSQEQDINENYIKIMQNYFDFIKQQKVIMVQEQKLVKKCLTPRE